MKMESKICLVIIFNHRFEKNIEKLKAMYSSRFSQILFLMPFHKGNIPEVKVIYESSFFFQNHINQGFRDFDVSQFEHYVFVGDDLILNPSINEHNIISILGLSKEEGYIKDLKPFGDIHHLWIEKYKIHNSFKEAGFDYLSLLPPLTIQEQKLSQAGLKNKKQRLTNLLNRKAKYSILQLGMYKNLPAALIRLTKGYSTPVPLVSGYSDFFVVPRDAMVDFVHICGVYGALNLWVEVAIPTALLLSCKNVITEEKLNNWYGTEIWGKRKKRIFDTQISTYQDIKKSFNPYELYIHPIKLSKINIDE